MLDGQFLKILRDKLSRGSTSSVLLNCVPGTNLYKIDITELNQIDQTIANSFVAKLLSEPNFNFPISYQHLRESDLTEEKKLTLERLSKKLNRVFNDNELSFQEKGHRTFGFGYPVFVIEVEDSFVLSKVGAKSRPKRLVAAPLFIWPIEIGKSFKQSRSWQLRKSEESTPFLNDSFASYIKQKHNVDLFSLFETENEEELTYEKLQKNVAKIVNAINKYEKTSDEILSSTDLVVPLRSKDELVEKAGSVGFVEWSGVLSLYSKQKQNLINELDQLTEHKEDFSLDGEDGSSENPFKHNFSALETDYSQQSVIDQLKVGSRFVIQGPPGTGKSQTLTALITNALSNGAKCLVVCEKNTALEVINNNLQALGLGDISALINDPTSKDRQKIVEKVRSAPLLNYRGFSSIKFQNAINDVNEKVKELSQGYAALMKNIWEDQVWADMLGKYLKVRKIIKDNPLKSKLKDIKWELNPDEYRSIRKIIVRSCDLREDGVSTTDSKLNKDFFKSEKKGLVKENIQDILNDFLIYFRDLQVSFDELPGKYKRSVVDYYKIIFAEVDNNVSEFENNFEQLNRLSPDLIDLLPASFNDNLTKITSIFSPKAKKANQYRRDILRAYLDLIELNKKLKNFKFNFLPDPEFLKLSLLQDSIQKFKINFDELKAGLGNETDFVIDNFLNKNKSCEAINPEPWTKAKSDLTTVIDNLNQIKLLNKDRKVSGKDTFIENKRSIVDIIACLEEIQNSLEDFSSLYDYERFLNSLNDREKKIIKVFAELKQEGEVRNKVEIFDRYYLEKILLNNQDPNCINDSDRLDRLYQKINELKQLVSQKVLSKFSDLQLSSIRSFPDYKGLYNLRGSPGQRRNSLRQIVRRNFNFFTNFFPVVLTNPTACSILFPLKQDLFDIVIFDEASQLRLEDTFSSLVRGKHKIISGDQHQMPPSRQYELTNMWTEEDESSDSDEDQEAVVDGNILRGLANSESLLDYALTVGYKKTHLLVHYRSNHPALIAFSNNAFYSGNLLPVIKNADYIPITFYQVNGLYTERTNPDEANKAIEILNEIVDLKNGVCPSVGIATFNIYQRDLILDKINSRASIEPDFAEKMAALYKKGFFVKNLENIQGDERDVIIMTTTFGKDKEGRFKKHFGPLQNRNGYRLLNVIVTRAKNHFYVCSSIPEEEYQAFERELKKSGKNDGTPIVFAYLAYARAVSDQNEGQIKHVLDVVRSGSTEERVSAPPSVETESPFEEEVLDELASIVTETARIKSQVWIGAFRVDFMVDPIDGNRKPLIIECDGAAYHGTSEAFAYDHFRKKQLRESGYEVYNIWSSNWFDENDFYNEVEELKLLLTEYDSLSPDETRFRKNEQEVFEELNIGDASEDADFSTEEVVENESLEEDLDEISELKPAVSVSKNKAEVAVEQPSFFPSDQTPEPELPMSSDVWFSLSHWGKEAAHMSPFYNRFCYTVGIYIAKKGNMTPKQANFAKKIYKTALSKGFVYTPSAKPAK